MKHITRLPPLRGSRGSPRRFPRIHPRLEPPGQRRPRRHRDRARSEENSGRFVGDAEGRSTGFARLLYPYDFRARSIVDPDSLRPLTFQLSERDRGAENHYDIIFEPRRQIFTTTSKRDDESGLEHGALPFRFRSGRAFLGFLPPQPTPSRR